MIFRHLTDADRFFFFASVKLKAFKKFENTTDALSAVTGIVEGKMPKNLKNFLEAEISEKEMKKEKLIISDPKLGMFLYVKKGGSLYSNELIRFFRQQEVGYQCFIRFYCSRSL